MQAVSPNAWLANHRTMGTTETEHQGVWDIDARDVGAGAASGLVAGIGMGIFMHFGTALMPILGAIAGAESVVRGWLVHLVISALYGALFAMLVAYPPIEQLLNPAGTKDYVLAAMVYAAMTLAAGVAGIIAVLPFILELPWMTATAQSANIPGPALFGLVPGAMFGIGHLVYGAILGFLYASLAETPV